MSTSVFTREEIFLLRDKLDRNVVAALVVIFLFFYTLSVLGRWVYNVWFHPLSKFPGPAFAAASEIPYMYATARGDLHRWIARLHDQYGQVVRYSPTALSYTKAQAWKDIFGHKAGGSGGVPKDLDWYGRPMNGVKGMITAGDEAHARMRRIFNNAFSDRALKLHEPMFKKYASLLTTKLRENVDKDANHKLDMVSWLNFTTFDVMGDLVFGETFHQLETATYSEWVRLIFDGIYAVTMNRVIRHLVPTVHWIVNRLLLRKLAAKREQHFGYASERVRRRLAAKDQKADIWSLVLKAPESRSLSVGEMNTNASTFMIAGTETTATLLSGLLFHLLKNPDKMGKLVQEIRGELHTEEDITMERLARLPYLRACIEEALRIYPPVPTGTMRRTAVEGAMVCGEFIPGNTMLTVSQYAAFRDANNWKDAYKFIPERFIDSAYNSDEKSVLQPFAVGPRNCLGKNMAYHEMRVLMAYVLLNFDLELATESEHWDNQKAYILWEKHPLMCHLKLVR
ncbi:benzoate 4-monooxygenase cytochrome P450 [Lineolata rhizophorae]|uniref:Benzoate 4-monooxygenase cytochrome P450 n=1 Tax=Lineolata rhizophorae TaxID=578093 RepID=A0A6A6P941_9PEZI|nr:benzoate 4-monooxygenase cytochrome P450 [Lineolata rhizophorae]